MKILCIGDLHLKDFLTYHELIEDHRVSEKKEVLDFIIKNSKDCDKIIFLGDQFNSKNNTSEVIREFVEFVESFGDKDIYIIAGNHEIRGDGKSAIDFMKEINRKNWHIITNKIEQIDTFTFCPYAHKTQIEVETDAEGTKKVMKELNGGDILFVHYAISDSMTTSGCQTNIFNEIVLPKKELEKRYKLVIAGHIHKPQKIGKTIITGSIFNQEIGENGKSIWKINTDDFSVEEIKLPGRKIIKLENPTEEDIKKINKNDIVKIVMTEKKEVAEIISIKKSMEKIEGNMLVENYPRERTKNNVKEDVIEMNVEDLLGVYAKQRKVPLNKLKKGWELIN